MTRGLRRDQIGVDEVMMAAFGETVFELSHNLQIREGDPVRCLDFAAIEGQRAAMGLTDREIAARIGLTLDQVTYIRTVMERRRFRTGHYARLNDLGGGRRFRAERFTPHLDHFRYDADALALRRTMRFDPARVRAYTAAGWWANDTLTGWLDRLAAARPDRPAIRAGEEVISYAGLRERSDRLAAGLWAEGIRPGNVVAVQLPNIAEFLVSYLAIARIGAVMTTIYMPHREQEIETLLRHSRARAMICLDEINDFRPAQTVLSLAPKLPNLRATIVVGEPPAGALSFEEVARTDASAPEEAMPSAADPFLLLYTSGTTASPKAVPLSYHNMLSNARLSAPEHRIDGDDIVLSAAPFGHLFALYGFHLALATGATSLLLPAFAPPAMAELIARARPTVVLAAPAHMAACLAAGLFERHDASSLKLVILSGSTLPGPLAHALAGQLPGAAITQLWGMTETQAGLYTRPDDPIDLVARSAGRPSPGTEIRIVDEAGEALGAGEEGELQVQGPLLFPGYFDNPAADAEAFTADGWFRTGDLAVRDQAGNVSITGRVKEIINRGGVKYNPRDVEQLLESHDAVAQCAIVPEPDERLGERACCYVVATPGATIDLAAACRYLTAKGIAKFKLPERLVLVEAMPLTPTRKIIKSRLAGA